MRELRGRLSSGAGGGGNRPSRFHPFRCGGHRVSSSALSWKEAEALLVGGVGLIAFGAASAHEPNAKPAFVDRNQRRGGARVHRGLRFGKVGDFRKLVETRVPRWDSNSASVICRARVCRSC